MKRIKIKRTTLAEMLGIGPQTLLIWEKANLLVPERDVKGHRVYCSECVKRCQFILNSQALGFTLKQIKRVLQYSEIKRAREYICLEVSEKLEELKKERHALKVSISILEGVIDACNGTQECESEFLNCLFSIIQRGTKHIQRGKKQERCKRAKSCRV